jgi:hypothetical protein
MLALEVGPEPELAVALLLPKPTDGALSWPVSWPLAVAVFPPADTLTPPLLVELVACPALTLCPAPCPAGPDPDGPWPPPPATAFDMETIDTDAIAVEARRTAKTLNIAPTPRGPSPLNALYGLVVAPEDVVPVAPAAAAPLPPVPAAAVLADAGAAELPVGDDVLLTPNDEAAGLPLPVETLTAPKPVA